MKQTAVEFLIKELDNYGKGISEYFSKVAIYNNARRIEKQSHKETWDVAHQAGRFEGKAIAEENWQTFETYWEEEEQ
jgi:hypothetical protein